MLLCSDEPILAEGLSRILMRTEELRGLSWCPDIALLRSRVEAEQPDLLLVDLSEGFTFQLLGGLQEVASRTRIILWVHSISTELALQAMSLGVRGILRKTVTTETLVRCLLTVSAGELWFDKNLTDSLLSTRRYSLTTREGQLISLLSHGLKNKEIAATLTISEGTVKVYLSRLFQKLGVKDRVELGLYGLKNLTRGEGAMEGDTFTNSQSLSSQMKKPPRSFFVERRPLQDARPGMRPLAAEVSASVAQNARQSHLHDSRSVLQRV